MSKKEYRMSIAMTDEMHEMLLAVRAKPEYRNMSIGELIRMMIEKGLEEAEQRD